MREAERPPRHRTLSLLADGEITLRGRMPWSSNGTFLVELCRGEETGRAVYKPLVGERPLWDYPAGLYRREVAAYVLSRFLGWPRVPETIVREGPLGIGSLQRFVEDADFDEHYFTLLERPEFHDELKAICAFDLVVNNGDRKAGHCLPDEDGRVWAIDHGLSFHPHPKLRTVMWDFDGQPVPPALVEDIRRVALMTAPSDDLAALLEPVEVEALVARSAAVVRRPFFPPARSERSFPWPLI